MKVNSLCILGGGGFIGRHLCHQLAARGFRVRVPTRDPERVKELRMLPTVDVVQADVHDTEQLLRVTHGADAVVNLVGVLHGGAGRQSFEEAHVGLARKATETCRQNGIRRYVHMSALNADRNGASAYLRTKGEAEAVVLNAGLNATILRPSVVFGPADRFLNLFATLNRWLPLIVLGSPHARFQPVYVEDVATAFTTCLEDVATYGQCYELCGPKVYTLRELVQYAGKSAGHARPILGLGDRLSYWQAWAMEWMPVKLLSRDNYHSMKADSVCRCTFPFGIQPTPLEAVAPGWLAQRTPRSRYFRYRNQAGR